MLEITKENYKDITFDGIIIGVDKRNTFDFCFVFECAYYTKGQHGYPKQGRKPDNSSFYSAFYNDCWLPNGLMFNATSRFTIEDKFRFEACDYYRFENMLEFCKWYIEKYDTIQKPTKHVCQCNKKQKRSEKLKDVIEYLDRYFKIQYYQTLAHAQLNPAAADTAEKLTQQLNGWLEEEI